MLAINSAFVGFEDAEGRPSAPAPATKRTEQTELLCLYDVLTYPCERNNVMKAYDKFLSTMKKGLKQDDDDDDDEVASMSQVKGSPAGRQGLFDAFEVWKGSWPWKAFAKRKPYLLGKKRIGVHRCTCFPFGKMVVKRVIYVYIYILIQQLSINSYLSVFSLQCSIYC